MRETSRQRDRKESGGSLEKNKSAASRQNPFEASLQLGIFTGL